MKGIKTSGCVILCVAFCALVLNGCGDKGPAYDASGTFEADETLVSSEVGGRLQRFTVREGERLDSGQLVGYVDSTQLFLKRAQLQAQVAAVLSRKPDAGTQVAALEVQLQHAQHEQARLARLVEGNAATQKQLDDANAAVAVLEKQLAAQKSTLGITTSSLHTETLPLKIQIRQLDDLLKKCRIVNPVKGTVLTRYAMPYEMTAAGKPLYSIADLSTLTLRAYITGDQFSVLRLGKRVSVYVDDTAGKSRRYEGTVRWISDKAEFTPRTIQTRDERANLVYAIKISVPNDGSLKIGMYGEVKL